MKRNLFILRHAKSDWNVDAATDFDRPLAKRGKKAIKKMGEWLSRQKYLPDYIISSPAERARQTAVRICKELKIDQSNIIWDPQVYLADVETLLQVLANCPNDRKYIMLIGHNPGLEMLVEFLAGANLTIPENGKILPTATVALFAMPDSWRELKPGSGKLISIIQPRTISCL